ncbi:MAG TPA: lytic transglycosylase domain-containing protein [Methylomirabilota bacterium]|nr:lytic transglycosylase domain-containing protein [Methylomirabilota bacterium]
MLGLAVLLLTLGGGYAIAQHGAVAPAVGLAELVDEASADEASTDEPAGPPTTAEILAEIDEAAARHRVPARLVAAIVAVESEFNPNAVSRRGAQGLMQLMPATAASLDVQDTFDLQENLDGGVRHLRVLLDRYHGDLPLVLAAYNAGDRAVIAYRGIPPYPQTQRYVLRVLRRYDPAAARAAAGRVYGAGPAASRTPAPPTRLVSVESLAAPAPPVVPGPWPAPSAHGADSP